MAATQRPIQAQGAEAVLAQQPMAVALRITQVKSQSQAARAAMAQLVSSTSFMLDKESK